MIIRSTYACACVFLILNVSGAFNNHLFHGTNSPRMVHWRQAAVRTDARLLCKRPSVANRVVRPQTTLSSSLLAHPLLDERVAIPLAMKLGYAMQLAVSCYDFAGLRSTYGIGISWWNHIKWLLKGENLLYGRAASGVIFTTGGSFLSKFKFDARLVASEPWRLFSCFFLHGDLLHLWFNLRFLHSLQPLIRSMRVSRAFFYGCFLLSTVCGSIVHGINSPNTPAVGASGGLFGLMGCLIAIAKKSKNETLTSSLMSNVMTNLFYGFLYPGVSNSAHIGGLLCDGILGFLISA